MKKIYMKPQMEVVKIKHAQMLCASNYGLSSTLGGTTDPEEEVEEGW
jgi:hypothetical protein